jgi:hypothetical protein
MISGGWDHGPGGRRLFVPERPLLPFTTRVVAGIDGRRRRQRRGSLRASDAAVARFERRRREPRARSTGPSAALVADDHRDRCARRSGPSPRRPEWLVATVATVGGNAPDPRAQRPPPLGSTLGMVVHDERRRPRQPSRSLSPTAHLDGVNGSGRPDHRLGPPRSTLAVVATNDTRRGRQELSRRREGPSAGVARAVSLPRQGSRHPAKSPPPHARERSPCGERTSRTAPRAHPASPRTLANVTKGAPDGPEGLPASEGGCSASEQRGSYSEQAAPTLQQ